MVAATEAALKGGSTLRPDRPVGGRLHFHVPSDVAAADVAPSGGGGTVVDLHGLSTGEARAAVLSRLSALQVITVMACSLPRPVVTIAAAPEFLGTHYNLSQVRSTLAKHF